MTPFTIVSADASHADAIADVYLAARAHALPYLRRVHTDAETRAWIRDVVLPRGTTWGASIGTTVVGFLHLIVDEVDQLYVHPEFSGIGIGTTLLALAKQASPHRLRLYTFQRNARACTFYEARGFRVERLGDGSGNDEGEPDVRYVWS